MRAKKGKADIVYCLPFQDVVCFSVLFVFYMFYKLFYSSSEIASSIL